MGPRQVFRRRCPPPEYLLDILNGPDRRQFDTMPKKCETSRPRTVSVPNLKTRKLVTKKSRWEGPTPLAGSWAIESPPSHAPATPSTAATTTCEGNPPVVGHTGPGMSQGLVESHHVIPPKGKACDAPLRWMCREAGSHIRNDPSETKPG